ncbi:hypothetical protein RYX56_04775 [Alkalihalophilus lindianensis]|uniref:Uncharacterized protein n=1 Tax=Alkalihalophilus lindianensis TaxID=1630542 RepID=A0ABU3X714_9BACI|nr:hypothetical protein [Alkalihalophilus lindianensis]MDV2683689.1 hypothetical protein [Alkalihalophilus lindianensis]
MKKIVSILFMLFILIGVMGYGIYYLGTNIASDRITEGLSSELNYGQMNEIRTYIDNDPDLRVLVEEVAQVDESKLPFTTKEEATRVLIRKVGITELLNIQTKVEQGNVNPVQLIDDPHSSLTSEEIMALKVIAYKELYQ